jgi:hypothetical protein
MPQTSLAHEREAISGSLGASDSFEYAMLLPFALAAKILERRDPFHPMEAR